MTAKRAVFIDRDGTLILEKDYLHEPHEIEIIPGTFEALAALRAEGFTLVVVTNQAGIARGYYGEAEYRAVEARLDEILAAEGLSVDATFFCPHHPDHGGPCDCRKPATGMYRQAEAQLGIDLAASYYVGDKLTDVLPALELSGRGILVRTGYGGAGEGEVPAEIMVADDLLGAVECIRGNAGRDEETRPLR